MTKASTPMSISKVRTRILLLSTFLTGISGQFPNLCPHIESTANRKNVASSEEKCGHLEIWVLKKKGERKRSSLRSRCVGHKISFTQPSL